MISVERELGNGKYLRLYSAYEMVIKVQSRLSKVERSEAEPRLLFADLRVL